MILEQNKLILSRRSFLGWTAKIGIIAVTTKIIPASLDDLEVIKCNMTATEVVNAHLIRQKLWSEEIKRILFEEFQSFVKVMEDRDHVQIMHDEWQHKTNTRQEIP